MNNLNDIKYIYFLGAGGIGMSALVRYFLSKGKMVAGYDRTETELTKQLNQEGANIHYDDNVDAIPEAFKNKEESLIVLTPAVPNDHSEFCFFRDNGFKILKRAQVLGEITETNRGICIAGTHGKTTTSSMTAHLLKQSHIDCNAFLGGILKNYDNNLLLSDKSDLTVIEADEYDRSFHWLSPYMAVITSVDPDHLDIYGTEKAYRESFVHFTSLIRENGVLLIKEGIDLQPKLKKGVKLYKYSGSFLPLPPPEGDKAGASYPPLEGAGGGQFPNHPDFYAQNIQIKNGEIYFDFVTPGETITHIQLGVPVRINIENGIAAMALAWLNGATAEELRAGMASFEGAKRRFDFHLKTDKIVLIDDYAHHPEELSASINSVKELYPKRKLTVIFQPHLFSRTRDFYKEFAESLSLSDDVMLLDIYPAREKPIPGITSQLILDLVTSNSKQICSKANLLNILEQGQYEVVLIAGAGDIDTMVLPIKQLLATKC